MSEYSINKKEEEKKHQQEFQNKFNTNTHKVKLVNQNQEHNVRNEGIQPENQKR